MPESFVACPPSDEILSNRQTSVPGSFASWAWTYAPTSTHDASNKPHKASFRKSGFGRHILVHFAAVFRVCDSIGDIRGSGNLEKAAAGVYENLGGSASILIDGVKRSSTTVGRLRKESAASTGHDPINIGLAEEITQAIGLTARSFRSL
jgi:hypothetical protein